MAEPPAAESPLLAALRQLPTGSLYSVGDKTQLLAALELCRQSAVRSPQWERGRGALCVEVVGGRGVREVVLTLEQGRLAASCECQVLPGKPCRHQLAVLFTLKKALAPASVTGWQAPANELETMRAALVEPAAVRRPGKKGREQPAPLRAAVAFAVVLEERHGIPFVEVTRNGLPAQPFDRDLPAPLRPLLPGPYGYGARPVAVLAALLDQDSFPWQVLVRDGEALVALTAEPPVTRAGRLRLDAGKEGLRLSRVLDDGSLLRGRLFWLDSWVADVEGRRLVRVAATEFWSLWQDLGETVTSVEPGVYRLPWNEFAGLDLPAAAAGSGSIPEELQLRVDGEELPADATLPPAYSLEVDTEAIDEKIGLMAGARTGERHLSLDRRALALFAEHLFRHTSAALRAYKRRRVLYETFLAARTAATKKEQTGVVRRALQGPDFGKRAVAREARELLEHFFRLDRETTWHLTFAAGRWQLLKREREREALLLEILYRHFGEPAFREAWFPGHLEVRREEFFSRLPQLVADLGQAGVELLFNDRPATPATLQIEVAATGSDLDWFELRPEIRCDGELLDSDTWRRALAEGMFEAGGTLRLLDAQSREALAVLAGLAGPAGKGRREVVRIPRLHILDVLALRRLGASLRLDAEDEGILESLTHFDAIPATPEPQLGAALRDYQRQGYRWLAFLYGHKFGACLADDMGLGKTIQAISLLAALQQGRIASRGSAGAPHLVVVPPSLLFNWEGEIARFAPDLRTLVYRGQGRRPEFAGVDVVLTSYDLVRRDIAQLAKIPFHVIIFDEAQAVKNIQAAVTGAVRRLQGVFKVALTGTPVENHLGEYWSIIDLVLPGLLGEYRRAEVAPAVLERLIARTRPFLLRRSKEKIAAELPDKVEIDLHLELTDRQKVLYQQTVEEIRFEVTAAYRNRTSAQARITALAALTRLRRLCLDPRLVGGESAGAPSPKIGALCDHLAELRDEGHSVLVFSQFTSFLDLVEPALAEQGLPWLRLDGSTPVGERKNLVERFQGSEEPLVFLLSLKAGGRGLNLTRATYVIHLDPWWNPAVESQASDRAHRIGQTRKVTVLRLLMRHTVEEKMMQLKERKQRLYKALLEEGRDGGGAPLTREDFEFLVGEGDAL